jgi:cbb3-type cytochrome oxidase maturation protein
MSVILILILASLAIALTFLLAFIWAVRSGQFEDTCTPGMRVLGEDRGQRTEATRQRAEEQNRLPIADNE